MAELKGAGGIIRATVTIRRAATGAIEVYELAGAATPEEAAALLRPKVDHGTSGAVIGEGAKLTNE